MSDPRQADTIQDFVVLWVRSQLTTQDEAFAQLRAYKEDFLTTSHLPDTITAFCVHLISAGLISSWQCQKLRNGQWQGFFLDQYQIVDHLGYDDNFGYYLARNVDSRAYVRLAVVPPARAKGPQIEYQVMDQF